MPSTPGESSAGASTPMTYPSPWDFDTTPLPAQEQPAGAQQFEYATQQDALYGGAPPPQNHAPTVIQLEERPAPLPRSRQRRAQGSRTPRLHVETTGESSAVRPSTAGSIAPSGPARVSPVHVHAERERERVHPYRRPHSAEDAPARARGSATPTAAGSSGRSSEQAYSVRFTPLHHQQLPTPTGGGYYYGAPSQGGISPSASATAGSGAAPANLAIRCAAELMIFRPRFTRTRSLTPLHSRIAPRQPARDRAQHAPLSCRPAARRALPHRPQHTDAPDPRPPGRDGIQHPRRRAL